MNKSQFYQYKESGLDDVYLVNGYDFDKDGNLFITDLHGLHKLIAESRVRKPGRLKGKEIRFLRHYLDWSQKALGEALRVDYQSVLRWETGKNKITKTAEFLLRGIVYEYLNGNARIMDLIHSISDLDNNRPNAQLEFSHTDEGWSRAA